MNKNDISRLLDDSGRVKLWPAKKGKKDAVLEYLSGKFETGRNYSEKEVNAILMQWHTFGDYFLLRRGLIESRFLSRTSNGSRYWKEEKSI